MVGRGGMALANYFTVPGTLARTYGYNPYAAEAAALTAPPAPPRGWWISPARAR